MFKRTDKRIAALETEVASLRWDLAQSNEREEATGQALDAVILERDDLASKLRAARRIGDDFAAGLIQSVPKS